MSIIIHIGLPKTATTTLQNALFANHSQIFYLGKTLGSSAFKGCTTKEWCELLKPVIWEVNKSCDVDSLRALYSRKLEAEHAVGRKVIGSWESLGRRPARQNLEMVGRISSVSGGCRLMISLRNPLVHLPSLYLQQIKGHFVARNKAFMGDAMFMEFDEWYSQMNSREPGACDVNAHLETIRMASEILGKENVGVFLFEDLIKDPDRYYQSICEFIGVDVEEGLSLVRQKHLHKRIRQGQLDWLRKVNASSWRKRLLRCLGSRRRSRLFNGVKNDLSPARVTLSGEMTESISAATRDGHRWLVDHYGLPLETHGYPL